MRQTGIAKAYLVLRKGKWDIPARLGDGSEFGMQLGYLMMRLPFGAPFTLDAAFPFVSENLIAFGFPDIIFHARNPFGRLLRRLSETKADVVIGLFPKTWNPQPNTPARRLRRRASDQPSPMDSVEVRRDGRVTRILPKSARSTLTDSWCLAVWTPTFTRFMHTRLIQLRAKGAPRIEPSVGSIMQAAVEAGLAVQSVRASQQPYLDIGTPQNLRRAARFA